MKNYFNHIAQSGVEDPLKFFREITTESVLLQAILDFMPKEFVIKDEGGNEIMFYEPNGNYRNVNDLDYNYEIEEEDFDYKRASDSDPEQLPIWVKYSFRDKLIAELENQTKITIQSIIEKVYTQPISGRELILFLNHDIQNLKTKTEGPELYQKFNEISDTLGTIKYEVEEIYKNLQPSSISSILEHVSTDKKIKDAIPVNKIKKEDLKNLYITLVKYDLNFSIGENEFVNGLSEICENSKPNEKLILIIGNKKTGYYILSKLKRSHNIDFTKLEKSKMMYIKETLFEKKYMSVFPSSAPLQFQKLISEWYEAIQKKVG